VTCALSMEYKTEEIERTRMDEYRLK